jgi:hypothetical protein
MSAKLKKQLMVASGVVIGTALFTKFVAPTLNSVLPNKA